MTKENNDIKFKEAQEALDSINEMKNASLKRVLPVNMLLGGMLSVIIGTQIALLGAGIRSYNEILIVLIVILTIAIVNKNYSTGVMERIVQSKRTILIAIIGLVTTYFLAIIGGQYLKGTFGFDWAPYAIGALVTVGFFSLIVSNRRLYVSKFSKDNK
jgi:hypothetical protein